MKKHILYSFFYFLVSTLCAQQRPYINSISPLSASVGEIVTISGTGFPVASSNLVVTFGTTQGTVLTQSTTLITVSVPAGALHDPITVTDLSTRLSGTSSSIFKLSFGGTFDTSAPSSNFSSPNGSITLNNQRLAWDLCLCDFDNDGKNDLAVTTRETASGGSAPRLVYKNTTSGSSTTFSNSPLALGSLPASNITCGDLNGDGKPEIVASQFETPSGELAVEVYTNTTNGSTISFSLATSLVALRDDANNIRPAFRIKIADINNDGKPEIITSNETNEEIDIFINNSTGSTVSFIPTPQQIAITSGLIARGIEVADFNNDNLPDIAIVAFNDHELFVFENRSTPTTFSFKEPINIVAASNLNFLNLCAGDFDGDALIDLATTSTNELIIFPNTSSSSTLSFGNPITQTSSTGSNWGLDIADIDGDRKSDIIIAKRSGNQAVVLLNNSSGDNNYGFTIRSAAITGDLRNIVVVDTNGDSKADILATSGSNTGAIGRVNYVDNQICVVPTISQEGTNFCTGVNYILTASSGSNTTYTWEVKPASQPSFTTVSGNSTNQLDISTFTESVQVRVRSVSGNCDRVSDILTIPINTNSPATASIPLSTATLCVGESLTISATANATNYFWEGPDNFSQSTTTASVTISNMQVKNAGVYTLRVSNSGGCLSVSDQIIINVVAPPTPNIVNQGEDNFCNGLTTTLEIQNYPGYTYLWKNGNTNLGTSPTQLIDGTGDYTVTITESASGCSLTSSSFTINEVNPPQSTINNANDICVGVPLNLSSVISSSDARFTTVQNWTIRDASNATISTFSGSSGSVTFSAAGDYSVSLITQYESITNCSSTVNETVNASEVPNFTISATSLEKCPEDSILLSFEPNLTTYTWSNGGTSASTYGKTLPSENQTTISITATTPVGCTVTDAITISNFSGGGIFITTNIGDVVNNQVSIPAGVSEIILTGNNGNNFTWEPEELFDNPLANEVRVIPRNVQTQITLSGTDVNNCLDEYGLLLINENIAGRRSFSPNGDGLGFECWEILNASTLSACEVIIFDKRGRNIFKANAPFSSDCIWDGTSNGSLAPPGIYYFVLKCDNSEISQSGSIFLAR